MPSLASSREIHTSFNFHLTIDGTDGARFSKVGSVEANVSLFTYKEAGANLPIKDPDQVDFPNITLESGASQSTFFYTWMNSIIRSVVGTTDGLPVVIDKRNVTIYQYNRQKEIVKKIQLYNAFPVQFLAGEWDNAEDKVVIERLTLAYDFFDVYSRGDDSLTNPTQF